ncbi:MAG TPA: DUF433 domain-containing protein [Patescibacteria group bacterium]|nr:DUF433 domain-containing protein [Patescibacteria group bacterium]
MTRIISTKQVLSGKKRISNTRISVDVIADYIVMGYGIKEIQKDYPHLTKEQIISALNYIEKRAIRERIKLEPKNA